MHIRPRIPTQFEKILLESPYSAIVTKFLDAVIQILEDNKLPFFPHYTDHGVNHLYELLETQARLVPTEIFDEEVLSAADVALIVCGTALHDLGMHIRPNGFLELIEGNRFLPVVGFTKSDILQERDVAWGALWDEYLAEVGRMSDANLRCIIGNQELEADMQLGTLTREPSRWTETDYLIIGEFIRRHHPRLAHEIALKGFPGVEKKDFPVLSEAGYEVSDLADLIGLCARSHGISLHRCVRYLRDHPLYLGSQRPVGTLPVFPMALLRVADYLHIDSKRAPEILLHLRSPSSPISIDEWHANQSVLQVEESRIDPVGLVINARPSISPRVYTVLRRVISGLQNEMDHASAVLDAEYGHWSRVNQMPIIGLAYRRIYTNIDDDSFRENLAFAPPSGTYSADGGFLHLLVGPLYGDRPEIGVRELLQNAVDAVKERRSLVSTIQENVDEVFIDEISVVFEKNSDNWILTISDEGVGMTPDTIRNYFLRAGASFRQSQDWLAQFTDKCGQAAVERSGRFGIGVFAAFLLGSVFEVKTRHVSSGYGYSFKASESSNEIIIEKETKEKIGTSIRIELFPKVVSYFNLDKVCEIDNNEGDLGDYEWDSDDFHHLRLCDFFLLDDPEIVFRVVLESSWLEILKQQKLRLHPIKYNSRWFCFEPDGYMQVWWSLDSQPRVLAVNGFKIGLPGQKEAPYFDWPKSELFGKPSLAVFDGNAKFPLTIDRYNLTTKTLPFQDELIRDMHFSVVAHALVFGPDLNRWGCSPNLDKSLAYPFLPGASGVVSWWYPWIRTQLHCIPNDAFLASLLDAQEYILVGYFGNSSIELNQQFWDSYDMPTVILNSKIEGIGERADVLGGFCHKGLFSDADTLHSTSLFISVNNTDDYEFLTPDNLFEISAKDYEIVKYDEPRRVLMTKGQTSSPISLGGLLDEIEKSVAFGEKDLVFVGSVIANFSELNRESSEAAKIWVEHVGPDPIPFDPQKRKEFLLKAQSSSRLAYHMDRWEEYARSLEELDTS